MKKYLPYAGFALVLILIVIVGLRSRPKSTTPPPVSEKTDDTFVAIQADREIIVHCGNSMRPVAERIAREYQDRHGIAVRFNFGGSAELLSAIELGNVGDLYICHDPYADRVDEKGLLRRAVAVGHLAPAIVVPPGNPQGIESLADLARPGLQLGLPDARYSTAGVMIEDALRERDLLDAVRSNIRIETRGHNEIALALTQGHIDVGMAWNFVAALYGDRLDIVSPGIEFPEIRVTVCLLEHARDIEAAELFMALAESPWGRAVFEEMGYSRSVPTPTGDDRP